MEAAVKVSMLMTSSLGSETVIVQVGPDAKQFCVHKDLICARSPFFQAALSNSWKEASERTVSLPEDDTKAFELYLNWLYTQKLTSKPQSADASTRRTEFLLLAKCVTLGEKLQDVRFKNALIDTLMAISEERDGKGSKWFPGADAISDIYEGTPQTAPIRRLLVDLWFWHGQRHWTKTYNEDQFHKTFLFDMLAKTFLERAQPSSNSPCSLKDWSQYHENEVQRSPDEADNKRKAETQDGSAGAKRHAAG